MRQRTLALGLILVARILLAQEAINRDSIVAGKSSAFAITAPVSGNAWIDLRQNAKPGAVQSVPDWVEAVTFIPADATDKSARVKSALSSLRTQSRASLGAESKTPRYQWFLFPAFALLLLDTLLLERRGRWFHLTPERLARAERWFDRWGMIGVFLGRLTPSPELNMQLNGTNIAISWLIPSTNFVLQQTTDLAGNWTTVPKTPALNFTNLQQETISPTTTNNVFFRLIAQ